MLVIIISSKQVSLVFQITKQILVPSLIFVGYWIPLSEKVRHEIQPLVLVTSATRLGHIIESN